MNVAAAAFTCGVILLILGIFSVSLAVFPPPPDEEDANLAAAYVRIARNRHMYFTFGVLAVVAASWLIY